MNEHFSFVYQKFEDLLSQRLDLEKLLRKTAELLHSEISHYNWVGFYLLDSQKEILILGPYAGAPTEHVRIPVGKGICGQVAESKQTMVVQDVTQQDNYLSCSIDVKSEIVVPIIQKGLFVAEIDIDSHEYAPFTMNDDQFLTAISGQLAGYFNESDRSI